MHIVAGELSDGAARGACWLHRGLLQCGVRSRMIVQKAGNEDPTVEPVAQTDREKVLLLVRSFLDQLPVKLYRDRENSIFSTGTRGFDICKFEAYQSADVVHLHWINNGMIDMKLLKKIDKPIVWTMRDMWPMTGGCHYAMDCTKFETGCGRCPQLKSNRGFDLSRYVLKRKKRYVSKNIRPVTISRWLADCAKRSALFGQFEIRVIHNCVDTQEFFPIERQIAREALGLPKNKKIILAGANDPGQKYKGFRKLQQAVGHLDKAALFIFFGKLDRRKVDALNIDYHSLGFIHDSISLRFVYSAADVFVAPSIQEAFGKTLIEAMACGTPVVAFDATGPRDIINHKKDGYLARPFEPEDLANGINWVLENERSWDYLSKNARQKVEREFGLVHIAKQYIKLYERVISADK